MLQHIHLLPVIPVYKFLLPCCVFVEHIAETRTIQEGSGVVYWQRRRCQRTRLKCLTIAQRSIPHTSIHTQSTIASSAAQKTAYCRLSRSAYYFQHLLKRGFCCYGNLLLCANDDDGYGKFVCPTKAYSTNVVQYRACDTVAYIL